MVTPKLVLVKGRSWEVLRQQRLQRPRRHPRVLLNLLLKRVYLLLPYLR